ncbi:hypothetical protein BDV97DRAFT_117054 [Delphinella strobiligena]|nr:hypothetical protein BDV97DRAFT_117054 [Delphinella strobiligena]
MVRRSMTDTNSRRKYRTQCRRYRELKHYMRFPVSLSLCLSISLSVSLSLFLSLCLCLSMSLCLAVMFGYLCG